MASPYCKMHGQPLWGEDSHFRTLPRLVQRCYLIVTTQPNMTHCGVVPLNPRRWSGLAPDDTIADFEASLDILAAEDYVVIDIGTDELWVRSWMRYDGLLQIHNGAKGVARAIDSVLSRSLAQRCRTEALRLCRESDRSLFEPPSQPPPKGLRRGTSEAAGTPPPTDDTNASEPVDDYELALAAAIEYRRVGKRIMDNSAWEPKTRAGIVKDYGHSIDKLLRQGHTPQNAAAIALGVLEHFSVSTHRPSAYIHDPTCICDGTGWVSAGDDGVVQCQGSDNVIPIRGVS